MTVDVAERLRFYSRLQKEHARPGHYDLILADWMSAGADEIERLRGIIEAGK